MYSADPVQPRPNPIRDAVPTPRPTPYLWTGLGWTNFGIFFSDEHLHTLCGGQSAQPCRRQGFGASRAGRGRPGCMPS
jgi:hypothetical protein